MWTADEESAVDNALAKLALVTRTEIDAFGLAAYAEALADRKASDVVEACRRLMATEKFMPSAGVISDTCKAISSARVGARLDAERKQKWADAGMKMPERVKEMVDKLMQSFKDKVKQ